MVTFMLPTEAEILHCDYQHENVGWFLWALVVPDEPVTVTRRRIRMAGTGHPIDQLGLRFINTVLHLGLVFHFFEIGEFHA